MLSTTGVLDRVAFNAAVWKCWLSGLGRPNATGGAGSAPWIRTARAASDIGAGDSRRSAKCGPNFNARRFAELVPGVQNN